MRSTEEVIRTMSKLKGWVTRVPRWDARLLLLSRLLLSTLRLLLLGPGSLGGGLHLGGLSTVVLADGLDNGGLLLGVEDGDGVRQRLLGTSLALGVGAAHDLDLDSQDTLAEQDVTGGAVDELLGGLTGVDHESVGELHGLGTGSTELSGDNDLATLGAGLHDEAEDTIASTTDGKTVEELVAEGLALGDGGETAVLDLGGVEGDAVLGELEALLDEGGELTDAATLLSENLLGVGGTDDDVGDGRGDADFDARVSLLSQLALEELVQLGVEDSVGDELSPLGTVWRRRSVKGALPEVCSIAQCVPSLARTLEELPVHPFTLQSRSFSSSWLFLLFTLAHAVLHRLYQPRNDGFLLTSGLLLPPF